MEESVSVLSIQPVVNIPKQNFMASIVNCHDYKMLYYSPLRKKKTLPIKL